MYVSSFLRALACVVVGFLAVGCGDDRGGDCPSFFTPCTNGCKNLNADRENCGRCGNICPAGQSCMGGVCAGLEGGVRDSGDPGMCMPTCSSAQRCCGTTCIARSVPPGTDGRADLSFMNCGNCGIACDAMRASSCSLPAGGSTPMCVCGSFAQCVVGEVCVLDGSTNRCVNLQTDRNNCGMIGNACGGEETCAAGMCACGITGGPCADGQTCCAGACIDTSADPMNCGGCNTACDEQGPDCVDGSCRCGTDPACEAPMPGGIGTPGSLGESCCDSACVANSDTNCGCGVMCDVASDETCIVGGGLPIPGFPSGGICCGEELIPGFGGICGEISFDGGFPSFDGGLPFP